VRHFRLAPTFPGCQSGNGIEVETTSGGSSNVVLNSNSVDDYQKNGITANETGSNVTIRSNFVSGIGPTTGAAQNGIQIGFGATGLIESNTVANNVWSPCVSVADCTATGTGILIFGSNNIRVLQNNVGTNQVGIFTNGSNTVIYGNSIFNSLVLDGIAIASNRNKILSNEIAQSDEAGVELLRARGVKGTARATSTHARHDHARGAHRGGHRPQVALAPLPLEHRGAHVFPAVAHAAWRWFMKVLAVKDQ